MDIDRRTLCLFLTHTTLLYSYRRWNANANAKAQHQNAEKQRPIFTLAMRNKHSFSHTHAHCCSIKFSAVCEILRGCCFMHSEQRAENKGNPEHLERPDNPPPTRLSSYTHTHMNTLKYVHTICYTSIYIHADTYITYAFLPIHTKETGGSCHISCF